MKSLNFLMQIVVKCALECSGPRKKFIHKVQPIVIIHFTGSLISKTEAPWDSKNRKKPPGKWSITCGLIGDLRSMWISQAEWSRLLRTKIYNFCQNNLKMILFFFFVPHNRFMLCVIRLVLYPLTSSTAQSLFLCRCIYLQAFWPRQLMFKNLNKLSYPPNC